MNYLDRYLEDVKYNLYGKDKNDIIKELRADILSKLGDDYTDEDLIKVLEELGSPAKVAGTYNFDSDGLIITGTNFNAYVKLIQLMAMISCIVATVAVVGTILGEWANASAIELILKVVGTFIGSAVNVMIISIGVLTIIFYFIERYDNGNGTRDFEHIVEMVNNNYQTTSPWTIKDLKVKRYTLLDFVAGTIAMIVFPLMFLVCLEQQAIPDEFIFFHSEYIKSISIIVAISIGLEIVLNAFRYFAGEKKLGYVLLNVFKNLFSIFASWYILIDKQMFFMPKIVEDTVDNNVFTFIFVLNLAIALSSIVLAIYRYIKLK